MAERFYLETRQIMDVTRNNVKELSSLWTDLFDDQMCKDNLQRLKNHAEDFYKDLIEESLEKKKFVKKEIDNLKEEAETLRRLLNTDVTLPEFDDKSTPLLVVQQEIDRCLRDMRETLQQRKNQICDLLLEQETLHEELGEPQRPLLADPLPTEDEIEDFRDHLEQLRAERAKRMNKLIMLRREIKQFLNILDLKLNTDADELLLNDRHIKLHKETFDALEKMHRRFGQQVEEVKDKIDSMRTKVEQLWHRLDTSMSTRKKIQRYVEYNQHTYDVYYAEWQRCEEKKRENIKFFVEAIRREIIDYWDKTLKSEMQRNHFVNFKSNIYTDDLLVLHEMELENVKSYYETNKRIFDLFAERKEVWERMCALEAKATDPNRFANRGGQLLKEEKERKIISKQLPEIEDKIKNLVKEYEERENEEFLVYGENILKVLEDDWLKKKQTKIDQSSARKNVRTPLTKSHMQSMRTPTPGRNLSTMSIRKASTTKSNTINTRAPLSSSTAKKRKMQETEIVMPVAKRGLFLQPQAKTPNQSTSAQKKPQSKLKKMIANSLRRSFGRNSGRFKKRYSAGKNSKTEGAPKIIISEWTDDNAEEVSADENYDRFQKSIEPDARSSTAFTYLKSPRRVNLPDPRLMRTPSKVDGNSMLRAPNHSFSSRKLTTKNLPIII